MDPQKKGERRTRQWLAIGIVVLSVAAVTVLGGIAIAEDRSNASDVLSQVLPLLGTWVGAIIAFYFAKENLETATRTTKELMTLDLRLKSVKVTEAMIPVGAIEGLKRVGKAKDLEGLKVADVLSEMKRNRRPVVDAKDVLLLVIHKSTLTEFLAARALAKEDPSTLTLKDLSTKDADLYKKLEAFAFVGLGETLAEAKRAMEAHSPDCADVFVTAEGKPSEPVLGWITNAEIATRSQA